MLVSLIMQKFGSTTLNIQVRKNEIKKIRFFFVKSNDRPNLEQEAAEPQIPSPIIPYRQFRPKFRHSEQH